MSIFNQSKYAKWYFTLIEHHAQPRKKVNGVYTEKHHIIPKSMGGSNEHSNIVCLSAKAHYLAHLILTKAVKPEFRPKAIAAIHGMSFANAKRKIPNYKLNSKLFQKLREEYAFWLSQTKWFNDGIKSFRLLDSDAVGLARGRLKLPPRTGVFFISDGITTRRVTQSQVIPEGWARGASKKNKDAWATSGKVARERGTALGKTWVNNGTENRLVKVIDDGWVRGRLSIGAFDPKRIRSLRGREPSTPVSQSLNE